MVAVVSPVAWSLWGGSWSSMGVVCPVVGWSLLFLCGFFEWFVASFAVPFLGSSVFKVLCCFGFVLAFVVAPCSLIHLSSFFADDDVGVEVGVVPYAVSP